MSEINLWNEEWEFSCRDYTAEDMNRIPEEWEAVTLPHDWLIYDTQNLYRDSIGWYRKKLFYTDDHQRWIIRFDAVYMDMTFYLNGQKIAEWKYGYSTFDIDLTDFLVEGNNDVLVRVVHRAPNSRWYSGAGIYRNVRLIKQPCTNLVLDGVYITPVCCNTDWEIQFDTEVYIKDIPIDAIEHIVFDVDGEEIATVSQQISFDAFTQGEVQIFHLSTTVNNPKLWDIGEGNLYTAVTRLCYQNRLIDTNTQKFGFRTIRLDAKQGFFLNGRHVKIQGVCEHHGFGCLGAVDGRAALKRKFSILRTMGVNAIRTAHNMPSVEFMELADEMGILVDSEAFDMWGNTKTTYDYGRFFEEWMSRDVRSWIRRDRNHPCIIMWSLGNEIYDMHAGEKGLEELKSLIVEARKHDPKGHAKLTFASNYMRWENTQKCAHLVDAVGYNYGEYLYAEHHDKYPDWAIYGSETASMLGSRNIYHFPLATSILCEDDEQCSALGNCYAGWGAHGYLDNILWDRDADYSLGQFIWTGFDNFGEPTPYHTRNSYFGQVDTAGFVKDSYYIYQAEWTNYKDTPMVHVFPYWDFNEGQPVDVCVCSNAPEIELLVNGRSLGRRTLDHRNGKELLPHWIVPYEQGEICAVAYDEQNHIIAKKSRHSFGDVDKLVVTIDAMEDRDDIESLLFVEISAVDRNGYPVENANNRVHIEVSGAGCLIGIDNGDSTDFDQVKGKSKRLFQGKLLAVIAQSGVENVATDEIIDDQIEITVTSVGLPREVLTYPIKRGSSNWKGIENKKTEIVGGGIGAAQVSEYEVPIRKLNLTCCGDVIRDADGSIILDRKSKQVHITCRIEPANATYHDIAWKVVNDIGIEVQMASVQVQDDYVILEVNSDGCFRLRCIAMNGGTVASVRSELSFRAKDIGSATLNPYKKIQGGLSVDRPDSLSEGVDHGVRFLGKKETFIRYEKLDFGKYGSEMMVAELFKYSVEPIQFSVFIEDTNFKQIGVCTFDKSSNWMEFLEQTCQLTERITGIRTIGIASKGNFQLKTIRFEPTLHGLQKIAAADCDEIYGDSYVITDNRVEKIGNNVTLHFKDLNFGTNTVNLLTVCGKTRLENCSIQVKVTSGNNEFTELIEFTGNDAYTEQKFEISPIDTYSEIRFIFLPGSQFDFSWFQLGVRG